jgi:hypothetical protein
LEIFVRGKAKGKTSTSIKGKQEQICVSLPPEMVASLRQLSESTRVPMAAYLREALEDLLNKEPYPGILRKAK